MPTPLIQPQVSTRAHYVPFTVALHGGKGGTSFILRQRHY